MNFISCYYPMCDHKAEACCNCTWPETYSCNKHFISHCKSSNNPHSASPIFLEPVEDTRRALLNFLAKQSSKIDEIKTKLITSLHKTLSTYEKTLNETLNEIGPDSTKINSYFDEILKVKKLTRFEKDPVLNLLVLEPLEAVKEAKEIFTENALYIGLFNDMLASVDSAITNFNEAKCKMTAEKNDLEFKNKYLLNIDEKNLEAYQLFDLILQVPSKDPFLDLEISKSLRDYVDHIKNDPQNDNAYFKIGNILCQKKIYDEALWYCNKAIMINSNNEKARAKIANILYFKNKYTEALEFCDDAIRMNSNIADYYIIKGMALLNLERREEAMDCYEEAIRIGPNKDSICNGIGLMFFNEKRYEEALMHYNNAIKINPNKTIYYINKAKNLKKLGRIEEVIQSYSEVYWINPNYQYFTCYKIANAYFNGKRYEEAVKYYNGAWKWACTFKYQFNKGQALYSLGKKKKAIKCFQEAIKINQNDERAYHALGVTYLDMNNYDGACKCYNSAIGINSNQAIYHRNLGIAWYGKGQNRDAIKCFESAIRIDPNEDYSYNSAGRLYYLWKNYEKALEYYNNAIRINPNKAIYYEYKGDAFKKIGRTKEAKKCYKKAQIIYNSS